MAVATTPRIYEPDYSGNYHGGRVIGGDIYSYDASRGLRERVVAQCMSKKGYFLASAPRCTKKNISGRFVASFTEPLPDINQLVCFDNGGYYVN